MFEGKTSFDQIESLDRAKRQIWTILFLNFYHLADKLKGRLKISFQTAFDLKRASQGAHC